MRSATGAGGVPASFILLVREPGCPSCSRHRKKAELLPSASQKGGGHPGTWGFSVGSLCSVGFWLQERSQKEPERSLEWVDVADGVGSGVPPRDGGALGWTGGGPKGSQVVPHSRSPAVCPLTAKLPPNRCVSTARSGSRERSHFSSSPLWSSPKKAQHLPLTMLARSRSPAATGCSGAEHPAPWGRSPAAGHPGATGRLPPHPATHHWGRDLVGESSWLFSMGFLTRALVSPDLTRLRDLIGDASGGVGAASCAGLCCAPRLARHSPRPGALARAPPLQERAFFPLVVFFLFLKIQ